MKTQRVHAMTVVPHQQIAAALLLLFLSACGGGGDSGTGSGSNPPGTAPGATSTCGLANFQSAALARVNLYRAAGTSCRTAGTFAATTPLAWNELLAQAAEAHSQDMKANNFFSHTGSNGSTLARRIDATGYGWSTIGENIAAGYATMNAVVDGWMASDGHCANIMNPNFIEFGLVCVAGTSTNIYNNYWTMDLGAPR